MRIAHVITTIAKGGAELQLLLLCKQQRLVGKDITVFPLKDSLDLKEEFEKLGVEVSLILHKKVIASQMRLASKGIFGDYDVLHAHLPQAEVVATFSHHKALIVSRHFGGNFYPGAPSFLSRILSRVALRRAKKVIAISDSVKRWLISSGEVPQSLDMTVVPYGFSGARFYRESAPKKKHKLPLSSKSALKVVCVARLSPEKNLPILLKAWARVKTFAPDASLRVYGDGPQRESLFRLCQTLELEPSEIFCGRTDDVGSVMMNANVLVLPSLFEGFGMVLLEAMFLGVPIVASDILVCREVLGSDGAGLFFDPSDEVKLSEILLNLKSLVAEDYRRAQAQRLIQYDIVTTEQLMAKVYASIL